MSRQRSEGSEREGSFYADALVREALAASEREPVDEVGDVTGDLRRRLREQLYRRPEDVRLLLQGAGVLVRALAARHRMSGGDREDLAAKLRFALEDLGDAVLPLDQGPARDDE